jgi:queuine tRNA-ribosyltransferase-like protein
VPENPPTTLRTRCGEIPFPAYIPVTTFGSRYPLDDLVRPYLPRLAPAVMVSLHYARSMEVRPRLPLLIDSGGFASLFEGARILKEGGLGVLERISADTTERLHPSDVLDFQEHQADVAFTLDFPIPPGMTGAERRRRLDLTIANAVWAIENRRRRDLPLYACVQGWDVPSFRRCAQAYAEIPFEGLAIGGLVPRAGDRHLVLRIAAAVRDAVPDRPLHVFGLGKPEIVEDLFARGVQSVDSSAYVKLAADGRLWGHPPVEVPGASAAERLNLALCNLAAATRTTLPLSARQLLFSSTLFAKRGGSSDFEER